MKISSGAAVRITGARHFTGTVLGANDRVMAIVLDTHHTVHLKRDPASTGPHQWRYGGLPVSVTPIVKRP